MQMKMRGLILGTAGLFVAAAQLQIPTRPAEPLFKGAQGKQRPEIHYDPATGTVTMKVLVQDPNGYRQSDTPIYIISLAQVMQDDARLHGLTELKMDWTASEKRLQEIAAASGRRLYSPPNTIDLSVIYGDIIENVKSRYVITYQSSNRNSPRERRERCVWNWWRRDPQTPCGSRTRRAGLSALR